jgi:hypothetical protein
MPETRNKINQFMKNDKETRGKHNGTTYHRIQSLKCFQRFFHVLLQLDLTFQV